MIKRFLLSVAALCLATSVYAQSSPNLTYGQVPTAAMWNGFFSSKQDVLGFTPLNQAGGTMAGKLSTTAPTTSLSGFQIIPGVSPTTPQNGDIWLTSDGLFYRAGNITFGPLGNGTITGPGSSVVGDIAVFANTSGTSMSDSGKQLPTGAVVGTSDTQTLTNKSIVASQINSGTLSAARLPLPTASTLGGVISSTAPANQFQTGINTSGSPTFAQPAFSNLSGSVAASQMPALTGDVTTTAGTVATTITSGTVSNSKLATASANTLKGNWTGSTASVTDNVMPSCPDTGGNHLNYVSGSGVTCGTTSSGGGLNSASVTPTNGNTTADLTGVGASARRIQVIWDNVGFTTNASAFLQIGSAAGGIVTTGYTTGGAGMNTSAAVGLTFYTSAFVENNSTGGSPLTIIWTLLKGSGNNWVCQVQSIHGTTTTGWGIGRVDLGANVLDRVRSTFSAGGTFNGTGNITILWE